METFELVDPGWNWGLHLLIVGIALAVPLAVSFLLWLTSLLATSRRAVEGIREWAGGLVFAALVIGAVAFVGWAIRGNYEYDERLTAALNPILEEKYGVDVLTNKMDGTSKERVVVGERNGETTVVLVKHLDENLWSATGVTPLAPLP